MSKEGCPGAAELEGLTKGEEQRAAVRAPLAAALVDLEHEVKKLKGLKL